MDNNLWVRRAAVRKPHCQEQNELMFWNAESQQNHCYHTDHSEMKSLVNLATKKLFHILWMEMSNCKSLETKNQIAKKIVLFELVYFQQNLSTHLFARKAIQTGIPKENKQTKQKNNHGIMGVWTLISCWERLQNLYPWTSSEFNQKRLWTLLWVGNSSVMYTHIRAVCYHSNLHNWRLEN